MKKCIICNYSNTKSYNNPLSGDYKLNKCMDCGLVSLVGSDANPEDFFSDSVINQDENFIDFKNKRAIYWSFPRMYEKYKLVFQSFFNERFNRLKLFNPKGKNIFDVGTGYGFWLDFCKHKNLQVSGIEISKESYLYCKNQFKIKVENTDLMSFKNKDTYDFITICDVIEHLENPNKELQKLRNMMDENSVLYIQVPDVLGFRLPLNYSLNLPHHLWQFNYKTLKILVEKNGFKVLKRYTGIMGVIGYYEDGTANLIKKIIWFIISKLKLGNRLVLVCKKI